MSIQTWLDSKLFNYVQKRGFFNDVVAYLGGAGAGSGIHVEGDSALQHMAVWACVRVLAESVSSLPLILYKRAADDARTRATDFFLYQTLHESPNSEMTSVDYREMLVMHVALYGNHYSEIERVGGRPAALWPLNPTNTKPVRVDGNLFYEIRIPGEETRYLPARNVMHVRNMSVDGVVGLSPIAYARRAVELGLSTEQFGLNFFQNGAQPGAVLEHPGVLGPDAAKALRESWESMHTGLNKSHRIAILEEGMKLNALGIPPEDSQFLQTRKFQVSEIARLFRLQPHMIADLDNATFSNIEHQSIEFVIHTLRPWLVRIEKAISKSLLTPAQRRQYYAEFLVDGLLRGDIATRYAAYATGRQNGWLSANDIRRAESMNPIPNGDVYFVPLNMIPDDVAVNQAPSAPETPPAAPDPDEQNSMRLLSDIAGQAKEQRARNIGARRQRLAASYERIFFDVIDRLIRREARDIRRASKKEFNNRTYSSFVQWLTDFYADFYDVITRQAAPAYQAYAEQVVLSVESELNDDAGDLSEFVTAYIESLASRWTGQNSGDIIASVDDAIAAGDDPVAAVTETTQHWEDVKPRFWAQRESIQSLGAFVLASYERLGVTRKRWVTIGEDCPYCQSLDGTVIELNDYFLGAGQTMKPDGADVELSRAHDIGHAPLHDGCDCQIVAERD